MKRFGFIGSGKDATTVGMYFSENHIPISGYSDVTYASADEAAKLTESVAYRDVSELVSSSDVIFIATPDDSIASVWDNIKTMNIRDKIIGIFSGSLSSTIFSGIDTASAYGVSVHPMYAFSDKYSDYKSFHTARLTVEGDDGAVSYMTELFEGLGHTVAVIDSDKKVRYHAAASIASNLMVGLYDVSLSIFKDCGFSEKDAVAFLEPLIRKNVDAMLSTSPREALTGPIERDDVNTVYHHLEVLSDEEKDIYIPLALRLTDISRRKNPDRDYTEMIKLLRK